MCIRDRYQRRVHGVSTDVLNGRNKGVLYHKKKLKEVNMVMTLENENRISETMIKGKDIYKCMSYENKLEIFRKANFHQSQKLAEFPKNIEDFIKSFIYLMYACKHQRDSKNKTVKMVYAGKMDKLKKGDIMTDYDSRYLLVPRYRKISALNQNKNAAKYLMILNEIGVTSLKAFVLAQDALIWFNIVDCEKGGAQIDKVDGKYIKHDCKLTQLTINDCLEWKESLWKSVSYTHLRAHETRHDLVCRLLLEKKKNKKADPRKQQR
eukprot:TRINITY_DN14386_c0_g1_i3.p1 TRINITY_DN14386_c0_g1~~TRINITY_DN14386_c0_g1_i3.p1  ORF type:complete len:265 (-),score=35.06 TRINITY_DN14386_c0_g1_i3:41-835(-)